MYDRGYSDSEKESINNEFQKGIEKISPMSKDKNIPVVEKLVEELWSEDGQYRVETEIVLYADYLALQSYAEKVTEEKEMYRLSAEAWEKVAEDFQEETHTVTEERDRAVELLDWISDNVYRHSAVMKKIKSLKEKD